MSVTAQVFQTLSFCGGGGGGMGGVKSFSRKTNRCVEVRLGF